MLTISINSMYTLHVSTASMYCTDNIMSIYVFVLVCMFNVYVPMNKSCSETNSLYECHCKVHCMSITEYSNYTSQLSIA